MVFKTLKKKLVAWLGPGLAYWTIKILDRTMWFEEINPEIPRSFWERGIPAIGAFWHGRLLLMPLIYKGKEFEFPRLPPSGWPGGRKGLRTVWFPCHLRFNHSERFFSV